MCEETKSQERNTFFYISTINDIQELQFKSKKKYYQQHFLLYLLVLNTAIERKMYRFS